MAEQVALLQDISETAHNVFRDAGFHVETFPKSISESGLADLAAESIVLGVRSGPKIPAQVLSDRLQAISVFGVGVNHVERYADSYGDLDRDNGWRLQGTDERGIAIFNAAHENTRSVAELVIGSVFSLMRDMHGHNSYMHSGVWSKTNGREVRDKTIGILGYGSIGSQVSTLAESIDMDVNYYDPMAPLQRGRAVARSSIEEVLAESDVVTLHMPGSKENYHLMNEARLSLMKPGSYLINAARGDLVDYAALGEALYNGHLAGAAIDVYTDENIGYTEPGKKGDDFMHVLIGHSNVLLLPHIGGSTVEAQSKIGESVAQRTVDFLRNGSTKGSVNLPNKALNRLEPGDSRMLHIHDNQPGAMAVPVDTLAEHGMNVIDSAQGTQDGLGYAIFDVSGEIPEAVVEAIRGHGATRRVRVIHA